MPGTHNRRYIVINEGEHHETGGRILCAWLDCENYALSLYVLRHNYYRGGEQYVVRYAFCSERCLRLFEHSHRHNGRLPPGSRHLVMH